MFLGPFAVKQEGGMCDSHFQKISLAAELQIRLEGSVEARVPVRRWLRTSGQQVVQAGMGCGRAGAGLTEGSYGGRTAGSVAKLPAEVREKEELGIAPVCARAVSG